MVSAPPHWPTVLPNIPDTLVFDWDLQLASQGICTGQIMWVIEYGFPEQVLFITSVQLDPLLGGYAGALDLRTAFLVALSMLGLPSRSVHQHF